MTKMILFLIFWRWKIWYFEPKSCWKYDIYCNWTVLVLIFSGMGNMAFFWAKKLMERWYLLITEKVLFWTFRWWEIWPFFQPKSWWKDDIYLVFLSFPWYSRTWEIWFFAQWLKILSLQIHKCTPFLTIFKVFVKCFSVPILLVAS